MTFLTVGEWLGRREQLTPKQIALVDVETGARLSYRALNQRARALAALLGERHGVRQRDRVAILAANCPEYLDAFFACALLGAIFVPLNWRLTARELATLLADCTPTLLLHDAEYQARATEAIALAAAALARAPAARAGRPRGWLGRQRRADQADVASDASSPAAPLRPLPLAAFPGEDAALAARAVLFQTPDGEEPALILYTSGTTGTPKGALLSHRMITWNALNTQGMWGLREGDVTPTFAPFFHAGGLNVLTTPLYHCGGTVVLLRSSEPSAILQAIERERCTIVFAVPTVFQAIMEHPMFERADFSSLRFCVTGGSSCPPPVIERYAARGLVFCQGYGLTEVGVNCFSLPPEDALRKAGSVGRPVFHSRARIVDIVDDEDRDVAPGAVGELALAGPHVCSGYWRRPEATAEASRDGWWHTGDLARCDADGYYYIVGRAKDMYISGGENVYPAEVEGVLAAHPGIAEVAIIAQPDPRWGEVGVAVVVPRAPGRLGAAEVLAYCDGKLARFKQPRRVVFVGVLPRNAMGKVLKAELRARYVESGMEPSGAPTEAPSSTPAS